MYSDEFTRLQANPQFEQRLLYTPNPEVQVYQMLQEGRIDGFLRSKATFKSLTRQIGEDINLEIHPMTVVSAKQHIIFSKKSVSAEIVRRFDEAITTIHQNARLDQLLSEFF